MRSSLLTVLVMLASVLAAAPVSAQTSCTITGTPGDDVLFGTDGDDVICGLGGNDILRGGRGDDVVDGGSGDDLLIGGAGRDQLRGGPGSDRLLGQSGRDRLVGNSGDDILDGGGSRDRLIGGPGLDDCTDNRGPSKRRACEPIADLKLHDMALETWQSFEVTEFVYSSTVNPHCPDGLACIAALPFPTTIHVRDGVATSNVPDFEAYTDTELFGLAHAAVLAGSTVNYDPKLGLPVEVESDEGRLFISDIQRRDALRDDLSAARDRWVSHGAIDYAFTFHNVCFCPALVDVRVAVSDGEITSTEVLSEDELGFAPSAKTIEQHFDEIESLLDGHAIQVDASFSESLGYPASYGVDHSRMIADEELTVVIFDVEIIESEPIEEPVDPAGPTLVDVNGITVAEEMAEQLAALLTAASADGFSLSGGGYRDPARQVELRRINCGPTDYDIWEKPASQCSPPTAIPGRSQHELGLAVDFTSSGSLVTSRDDPAFLWLVANAETFGLFNHPQEPWHWSTTGN